MLKPVAIIAAKRTPIGKFMGSFADTEASALGVVAAEAAMRAANLAPEHIDQTIFGHARQAGCGPNGARQVSVGAGIPETSPAMTINQACGSGLQSLLLARERILLGEADIILAGGMENMTRVPYLLPKARLGNKMGHTPLVDAMYRDGFVCPMAEQVMGETAEALADKYKISREEQDAFAAHSQNKAEAAWNENRFANEIAPVTLVTRKGERVIDRDEHPRAGVTPEALAKLPPVFRKGGTVHAGNSSGITDGAAALILASQDAVQARGLKPMAWLESGATAGVDPKIMGIGPVPALQKLQEKTGRDIGDYDRVELNEAFAAQVIAVDREIKFDPKKLNVNGGAIALGHPIGATGARIVVTLLHELERCGGTKGVATLCVSGGLGVAASFFTDRRS